jgi:hypothetical protein
MRDFIPILVATYVVTSRETARAAGLVCGLAVFFLAGGRRNSSHYRTEGEAKSTNAPICCICGTRVSWEFYSDCKSNFARFGGRTFCRRHQYSDSKTGGVQASDWFDEWSKKVSAI